MEIIARVNRGTAGESESALFRTVRQGCENQAWKKFLEMHTVGKETGCFSDFSLSASLQSKEHDVTVGQEGNFEEGKVGKCDFQTVVWRIRWPAQSLQPGLPLFQVEQSGQPLKWPWFILLFSSDWQRQRKLTFLYCSLEVVLSEQHSLHYENSSQRGLNTCVYNVVSAFKIAELHTQCFRTHPWPTPRGLCRKLVLRISADPLFFTEQLVN